MLNRHQNVATTAGLCRLLLVVLMVAAVLVSTTVPLFAQAQSGITAPAPGAVVSGDVQIMGTAVIEPFQKYELHYKLEPSGDDAYIYFGGSTAPVINGPLGVWQAGALPPGAYSLRLRVVKADGNYAEFYIPNLSLNQGSQGATPTSTSSEPTPTPIPTATYTPAPQPTAAVGAVQQPQVEGGQPIPTPTPGVAGVDSGAALTTTGAVTVDLGATQPGDAVIDASDGGLTRELGESLSFERLRSQFWSGVRYSVILCLGVLALFGGKRLFDWVWTQFR